MRRLLAILTVTLLPGLVFAADGNKSRFSIFGYYGLAMVSPTDMNNYSTNASPKLATFSSTPVYGGGLTIGLSSKFRIKAAYDILTMNNITSNTGLTVSQQMIWGDLDYMLVNSGKLYVYIGGGAGYPMQAHLQVRNSGTNVEYDADKAISFNGELGLGFMLGSHFALFFEGSYQSVVDSNLRNSSNQQLQTYNSSGAAKVDLSGARGIGGLEVMF